MKRILRLLLFLLFMTGGTHAFAQANVYLRTNTCGAFWNSSGNEKALDAALGVGNWQYKYFETVDVAALLTKDIDFLFIEGSNCGTDEMVEFLDAHRAAIENWVSEGGNLLINAAPNEGPDVIEAGFGDIYMFWVGDGSVGEWGEAANPNHPMFKGPLTPAGNKWSGGSFAHFQIYGEGLSPIIKDAYSEEVYLAEKDYGKGSVMFGGLTLSYFQEELIMWAPKQEVMNIHINLMKYMARGRKAFGGEEDPKDEVPVEEEVVVISSVALNALQENAFCRGTEVVLPFTVSGVFQVGNVFTLQLSDASGDFGSYTTVGSFAGEGAGAVAMSLPANLSAGSGYRIRLVASNPEVISESVGIAIKPRPTIAAPADLTVSGTPGVCGATAVALGAPYTTGDCIAGVESDAPASFPLGTTSVTWTLTDLTGNKITAVQKVTVIGAIPEPVIAVSANLITLGFGTQEVTLSAFDQTSASGASTFAWSPVAGLSSVTGSSVVFEPTAAGAYPFTVTATNEFGCKATTSVVVNVLDARCGTNNDKVLVCHNEHEICISPNAVQAHLDHGCSVGSCNSSVSATTTSKATALTAEATGLIAYPNPFTESTTIGFSLKQSGVYRVELLDVKGSVVREIAVGEGVAGAAFTILLNKDKLKDGVYIVRLVSSGEVKTMKLVYNQ